MGLAGLTATASAWAPGSSPGATEEGRPGLGDGCRGPRNAGAARPIARRGGRAHRPCVDRAGLRPQPRRLRADRQFRDTQRYKVDGAAARRERYYGDACTNAEFVAARLSVSRLAAPPRRRPHGCKTFRSGETVKGALLARRRRRASPVDRPRRFGNKTLP